LGGVGCARAQFRAQCVKSRERLQPSVSSPTRRVLPGGRELGRDERLERIADASTYAKAQRPPYPSQLRLTSGSNGNRRAATTTGARRIDSRFIRERRRGDDYARTLGTDAVMCVVDRALDYFRKVQQRRRPLQLGERRHEQRQRKE